MTRRSNRWHAPRTNVRQSPPQISRDRGLPRPLETPPPFRGTVRHVRVSWWGFDWVPTEQTVTWHELLDGQYPVLYHVKGPHRVKVSLHHPEYKLLQVLEVITRYRVRHRLLPGCPFAKGDLVLMRDAMIRALETLPDYYTGTCRVSATGRPLMAWV